MQGMRFLLINEQGAIINNGVITQRVTEERYMCTFMRPPQVSRLVHVDEIATWNLFPNDEAVQAFVNELQQQPEGGPTPPPGAPSPDGHIPPGAPDTLINPEGDVGRGLSSKKKKVTKKKAAKKKAKKVSKKRNGK